MKDKLIVFVAQGFGVGRIPWAPGTFGSVVGLGWFALLLATGNIWLYALGTILGLLASVWFCGRAEKILGQTDPSSVVLDEIAAIPVCFGIWIGGMTFSGANSLPPPEVFFFGKGVPMICLGFGLFRLFDVWKPWPVRQSQTLPGGWGITIDDLLAAIYVNFCYLVLAVTFLTFGLAKFH